MEKMLVLMMSKDNAKRAAPIGAGLVAALRHCEARSSPVKCLGICFAKKSFKIR